MAFCCTDSLLWPCATKLRQFRLLGWFIVAAALSGILLCVVTQLPTHKLKLSWALVGNSYRTAFDRCNDIPLGIRTPGGNVTRKMLNARDWKSVHIPLQFCASDQNDPNLIKHISDSWILPPHKGPRMLKDPQKEHYSQVAQSEAVNKILSDRKNGFFIECGAADGEECSNSLFFEKSRNWTGLLIEPRPLYFRSATEKQRNAYLLNACVSPSAQVEVLNYTIASGMGGLSDFMETSHVNEISKQNLVSGTIRVPCFPMTAILRAIKVTHVDYFSLDVEGPELDVLRVFPFDEVTVDIITVEYLVQGCTTCTRDKLTQLREFFTKLGNYKEVQTIADLDIIFKRV